MPLLRRKEREQKLILSDDYVDFELGKEGETFAVTESNVDFEKKDKD